MAVVPTKLVTLSKRKGADPGPGPWRVIVCSAPVPIVSTRPKKKVLLSVGGKKGSSKVANAVAPEREAVAPPPPNVTSDPDGVVVVRRSSKMTNNPAAFWGLPKSIVTA